VQAKIYKLIHIGKTKTSMQAKAGLEANSQTKVMLKGLDA